MPHSIRRALFPVRALLVAAGMAAIIAAPVSALAQTSVPNPLRGKPVEEKPAERPRAEASRPKAEEKAETPAKPKRERSAKQKEGDEIMRACGATWRAEKAALQAKGETWRGYLKECRAKRKGELKA